MVCETETSSEALFVCTDDPPPADVARWTFAGVATRGVLVLSFPPDQAMRRVRVAGRWQTRRGELGPWSQVSTGGVLGM